MEAITTPDQRLRVFVSAPSDMADEAAAAAEAIAALRLHPLLKDSGARTHSPQELADAYLEQSQIFIGVYGTNVDDPSIDHEFQKASHLPRLLYIKSAGESEPETPGFLAKVRSDAGLSYRQFDGVEQLTELIVDDLAVLISERFDGATTTPSTGSGTYTYLVVDIEDSTPLLQALGAAYADLLRRYQAIIHVATAGRNGEVVSTEGDGLMCAFSTPSDAVEAAIEIQTRVTSESWPEGVKLRCRIGLHTGAATRTAQGLVGIEVNRAGAVGGAAHGGQILASASTVNLVEEPASRAGWALSDLGTFTIGERTLHLYRIDSPGLPVITKPPRARAQMPSSVPIPPHALIGRVSDVEGAIEMLLRESVRLVTVTGPGGTGKTRLAIEIARRMEHEFKDGVVFVDLSAVRSREQFLPAVGRAFGVLDAAARGIVEGLTGVFGDAEMLLVMDNMEQLLVAGPEIAEILEGLPRLRVLVTSRSPLRLSFEHEYPLLPLPVPEEGAGAQSIRTADAVALFVQRAAEVRPGFELNEANQSVIAEITRRLDGLPLAIELAAARLRIFTPEVLLDRLDDRLSLLDRGPVDAPERHRTLRAAIQWSHDLLDPSEQVLFRRLSVFAGGWHLGAALAVCADEGQSDVETIDLLESLVAKSLVVFAMEGDGQPRYRMLETLREYALEKLGEAGEEHDVRRRHLQWCQSLASRLEELLPTPEFPNMLDDLDRERFNLREALRWSVESGIEIEGALWACGLLPLYWDTRGYVTEGLEWTSRLLGVAGPGTSRGRALAQGTVGWLGMLAGDPDRSEMALLTSDAMWRELGDTRWLARSLAMHGMTTYNRNDMDAAQAQFDEAVILAKANGIDWLAEAWCAYGLAHVALARNDFMTADRLLHATLDYSRELGLTWGVGHAQLSLGVLAFMMGDLAQAGERLSESLEIRRKLKDARGICDCLAMMALLASVQGSHSLAAVLLGAAEVRRQATGHTAVPWQQPLLEQAVISARDALGESGYQAGLDEGRSLSTDDAIALAIDKLTAVAAGST